MLWIEEDIKDHLVLPPVQWSGTQIGCSNPHPALANTALEPFKSTQCLRLGYQKPRTNWKDVQILLSVQFQGRTVILSGETLLSFSADADVALL